MQNTNKILDFILKIKEVLFVISAVILAALNVYFGYKFAPYTKGMESIEKRVSAVELSNFGLQSDIKEIKLDVKEVKHDGQQTREDVAFIRGLFEK